jgi:uncharacterized protein (TIGR04255 family)
MCSIVIVQGRKPMPNMLNAPLVYTLGALRFPPIPKIEEFQSAFLSAFRKTYPQFDEIAMSFVRANIAVGPDSKSQIDSRELKMFQFASPDREWALILSESLFGLHTSKYVDHEDFIQRFKAGLRTFLEIPGLNLEWIEAIGFRYVDLVKPRTGEPLGEYLHSWVLPPLPEVAGQLDLVQGMYIAQYKTPHGDLRFQSLRNPPMTLPPDLNTPFVQKNGWVPEAPEEEFALMDIDHGRHFSPLVKVDIDMVCTKLLELRSSSRELFDRAGTPRAMDFWKGEVPA